MTAEDQHTRNNKLMTNIARNKVFKFKKFTYSSDFIEMSYLWHLIRVALGLDKVADKDKVNHYFNTHRKAIVDALSRRRTAVTNQMKMNFISK